MSIRHPFLPALAVLALGVGPVCALEGMTGIHDPSKVAECGGKYYVFGTGRGISVLTSRDGFNWERGPKVFERIPESVKSHVPKNNGEHVWASDIIKHNNLYHLYYSVSSWGSYVSAVGLMTNPTLDPESADFKWTDRGMVVRSVEGQDLNAIDPGVIVAPDGKMWVCYGSYHGNIEMVELDPKTGLRVADDSPVSIVANRSEAADLMFHDGYYYLFVNQGSCCQGTDSTYHIRVGRSKNATGPYLDRHGENLARGGGTLFLASAGTQVGPGHFGLLVDDGVQKFSCHYEGDLAKKGRSFLEIRPLLWTPDGWPVAGENVTEGVYQIRSLRSGSVLQVPGGENGGSLAETARYTIRDHQKWNIAPAGGGFYKIVNVASSNALEDTAKGEAAVVATFNGADSQLWKIDQLADGSFRIASKTNKQALAGPGKGVALKLSSSEDAQRWIITAP